MGKEITSQIFLILHFLLLNCIHCYHLLILHFLLQNFIHYHHHQSGHNHCLLSVPAFSPTTVVGSAAQTHELPVFHYSKTTGHLLAILNMTWAWACRTVLGYSNGGTKGLSCGCFSEAIELSRKQISYLGCLWSSGAGFPSASHFLCWIEAVCT